MRKVLNRQIYILSAKYGLLELNDYIEPYNTTLNNANNSECKKWAVMVYKQMLNKGINFDEEALFLCGKNYRKYIITKFKNANAPLKNMRIGQQLNFYKKNIK